MHDTPRRLGVSLINVVILLRHCIFIHCRGVGSEFVRPDLGVGVETIWSWKVWPTPDQNNAAAQLVLSESLPIGEFDLKLKPQTRHTWDVLISTTMEAQHSIDICAMYWYVSIHPHC